MDRLEYQLDTINGTPFESVAADFLRHEGYDVHESGRRGTDGGWDARVEIADKEGIAHASVRNDWKRKLREDAESVAELEENRAEVSVS